MLKRIRSLWRALRHRNAFEDDMDAEIRFHLDSRGADLVAHGLSPADAARAARLEFGSIEKQKDLARASVGLRLFDELGADFRYALRTFNRNKGFTAAAVVTLTLGIGANAAIFSLIDALMLRWLPVHQPQELLRLEFTSPGETTAGESFSYPLVTALDAQRDVFTGVAGFTGFPLTTGSGVLMTRVPAAIVTGSFYDTLEMTPAAGRLLTRSDDVAGAPLVAVASYGYWERQYARSLAAIGQRVLLNGVPAVLVGVSAPGFVGANVGSVADLTIPAAALPRIMPEMAPLLGPGNFWLRTLARLKPDVPPSSARARLSVAWPRIAEASVARHWPASRQQAITKSVLGFGPGGKGWTYLREMYVTPLRVLMGVVAIVLLIACANVASLLLARASARRREIAVRLAIGAGRGRIIRQLLVESATLAFIGAAGGIVLAIAGGRFLVDVISTGPAPLVFDLTPNWHVMAFTTGVAVATTLLFGLAPALQSTAVHPVTALKDDSRIGGKRSRLLPSLVTGQLALSLILLIGAGLFVRTLRNLQAFNPGFRTDGVLIADLGGHQPLPASLVDEVRRIPGVVTASVSTHTPLSGSLWSEPAVPAGQPVPERDTALFVGAGPGFFATLGVELIAGREFTERDTRATPHVAIVNARYAERFLAKRSPLGQHLTAVVRGEKVDLEIIGVARNANAASLRGTPPRIVYVPYGQLTGDLPSTVSARATGSLNDVSAGMRQVLQPWMPNAPVDVRPLSAQVAATMVLERMMATLASGFGVLALILAGVGTYGLLAYGVARRTREIGIRMALGAGRRGVMALVLRGALIPLLIGLAIGLPMAWATTRWIESMLFGLTRTDPAAIGMAIVILGAVAYLAAYVPARRAARVDPLIALRCE